MSERSTVEAPEKVRDGYRAAHNDAVMVDRSNLGMLKLTGKTRLDLINRMSTQKVNTLIDGSGAATVLTTDIGRIIDRLILYATKDAVYCLTGEDNNKAIASYLKRYVFFMDDFTVEDLSQDTAIIGVYGVRAGEMLSDCFSIATDLPLHHWISTSLEDLTIYLHRTDPVAGGGFFLMSQQIDKQALWRTLAAKGIFPIDDETFEYLRIESGLPRFGHELTPDYIPLEANLWSDVSFNKGCYTGQEIIARMESRGRLAKRLVSLQADAAVKAGSEITASGKQAGKVTSVAHGPAGWLALGYIKTSFLPEQPDGVPEPTFQVDSTRLHLLPT